MQDREPSPYHPSHKESKKWSQTIPSTPNAVDDGERAIRLWFSCTLVTLLGILVLTFVSLGQRVAPVLAEPAMLAIGFLLAFAGLIASTVGALQVARRSPPSERASAIAAGIACGLGTAAAAFGTFVAFATFDDPWGADACRPDGNGLMVCSYNAGPILLRLSALVSTACWLLALALVGGTLRYHARARGHVTLARLTRWTWVALVVAASGATWYFAHQRKKSSDGSSLAIPPEVLVALGGVAVTIACAIIVASRLSRRRLGT